MMTEMVTVIAVFCIRGRSKVEAAHFLVNLAQILGVVKRGVLAFTVANIRPIFLLSPMYLTSCVILWDFLVCSV